MLVAHRDRAGADITEQERHVRVQEQTSGRSVRCNSGSWRARSLQQKTSDLDHSAGSRWSRPSSHEMAPHSHRSLRPRSRAPHFFAVFVIWSPLTSAAVRADNSSPAKSNAPENGRAEQDVSSSVKISSATARSYINWIIQQTGWPARCVLFEERALNIFS